MVSNVFFFFVEPGLMLGALLVPSKQLGGEPWRHNLCLELFIFL